MPVGVGELIQYTGIIFSADMCTGVRIAPL